MCQHGMVARDVDGVERPALKPTKWLSSAPELLKRLERRCRGGCHKHAHLIGGTKTSKAAIYPPELCKAILQGIMAQKEREGRMEQMKTSGAVYSMETERPEYKERALHALAMTQKKQHEQTGEEQDELRDWDPQERNMYADMLGEVEQESNEYYDDITGEVLPKKETRAARREEVEFMRKWRVWDEVPTSQCWTRTGRRPLKGRWVDHNKGDSGCPAIRCRWVAKEIATYKDIDLFAATPPLEALRAIMSFTATGKRAKGNRKIMKIDVRKAHLHATPEREIYVELPPEIAKEGMCTKLNRCLYGTRDAASRWESLYTKTLQGMGFTKGLASSCCFYHAKRGIQCVVHGDDFVFAGDKEDLVWARRQMENAFLCTIEGTLGGDAGDAKEMRVLNRILRWSRDGLRYEGDPRHVEMLVRDMGAAEQQPLTGPGGKEFEEEGAEEPLAEEEIPKFRTCAARANYLSLDRPDTAFAAK